MKAKPFKRTNGDGLQPCDLSEATHIEIHLQGPFPVRLIPVILKGKRGGTDCWTWNGDTEKPTLKPSILTKAPMGEEQIEVICHTWITDGQAIYLNDSTHEYAGQTLDLLEVGE